MSNIKPKKSRKGQKSLLASLLEQEKRVKSLFLYGLAGFVSVTFDPFFCLFLLLIILKSYCFSEYHLTQDFRIKRSIRIKNQHFSHS